MTYRWPLSLARTPPLLRRCRLPDTPGICEGEGLYLNGRPRNMAHR